MTGLKTNERPGTRARISYVRVSAYKAREVLDEIRGLHVADAADYLQLCERGVAEIISGGLDSAVANAEHNDLQDADELYVSACYADEGPTMKRWRPRARGRATRIRKRSCHITIIVSRMDDAALEIRRAKIERRLAGGGGRAKKADRSARVARSRGEAAPAAAAVEPDPVEADGDTGEHPYGEGSHAPLADESMPDGYPIKGNADSMKYHQPDGRWYEKTVAEVWFTNAEAAEAAGFVEAGTKTSDTDDEPDEQTATEETAPDTDDGLDEPSASEEDK